MTFSISTIDFIGIRDLVVGHGRHVYGNIVFGDDLLRFYGQSDDAQIDLLHLVY